MKNEEKANKENQMAGNQEGVEDQKPEAEKEGVLVPEEFQQKAHALIKDAKKPHLSHLRDRINQREDEIRDTEMKQKKIKSPGAFSTSDMPSN